MSAKTPDEKSEEKKVKLWDFPVRLFHWALVVAIVTAWWSNRQVMIDIHAIAGYSVLTLVVFRIIWGFVGSSNARFASFLTGPKRVFGYASKIPGGSQSDLTYPGHNPAGGWMVVVLLLLVGIQAFTGLFATEDTFLFFDGPLVAYAGSDFVSLMNWIHGVNINLIYGAVGLHVFAALFYLVVKRENLVGAMITGARKVPSDLVDRFARIRFASPVFGIGILAVCGFLVWAGVGIARG